ncbi:MULTISPECIES: hypothetical protein [Vibrio oreintalis group]|uniref:hypothetical protein n=1 Tax=Vibrio oreintalis group TaxID=1891919 RepID=UPI00234EA11D|nr:hypothetical protein [Vibrio tubiashii]WCP70306.1 hypothetical protein LYZ37_23040 [Vibrio tubiashii]
MADLKSESNKTVGIILACLLIPIAEFQGWEISKLDVTSIASDLCVIAILTAFSLIVTNLVDREIKFKLAFFSSKKPAYHCKKYSAKDSRLDSSRLIERWPEVFSDNSDKSKTEEIWYTQIYLPVRDSVVVRSANKQFLIARDCYIGWIFISITIAGLDLYHVYDFSDYALQFCLAFTILLNLFCRATGKNLVLNSICESLNNRTVTA